jgi:multicomponent Na+:H+ antiporter subunit E
MVYVMKKIYSALGFLLFYIFKVFQANFELAFHILSPRLKMKPGIMKIPVNLNHSQAILLLVNMITMTPGTLTIDITEDKRYIYVHFLFLTDEEKKVQEIKNFEKRIADLFS